ncbi:hypothetical protein HYT18_00725 [Candidatus Microgenomates bacterium]|nr:hypothetical protein [Candidatus Microgenomates bacterium]
MAKSLTNRKKLLIIFLVILALVVIFQKQLLTHLKIILFITEEFPQIPVKPLGLITQSPQHEWVEFDPPAGGGKVVADLYIPQKPQQPQPAVILAMGVKTSEDDKPLIWHFGETMARLGYVVLWPRLEVLDKGQSLPEEPETFLESFKYVAGLPQTDSERITFVGFSVGSSTALVAASQPEISDKVHALVFFGGQFNIFDYLLSLTTKTYQRDGKRIEWKVADDARNHTKTLLEVKHATQASQIFEIDDENKIKDIFSNLPSIEKEALQRYNPQKHLPDFKGKLFILHDMSDNYVPYVESVKLSQALPKQQIGAFILTNLFEHVQPKRPLSWQNIKELFKLYGFLYKTLNFL